MGARPLAALNLASLPGKKEFFPHLKEIFRGGIEKMSEAGVPIIGGHTIKDNEPKFGFAVMGVVHPQKILDNTKARKGDAIVLTKPIGTGVVSTGVKAGLCEQSAIDEITNSMASLNKKAGEAMLKVGVSTATDITGFGLIGHLYEVLSGSDKRARLHASRVPFFEEALRLADMVIVPGGTVDNSRHYGPYVRWSSGVGDNERVLMNDAQTSGGLLIFVSSDKKGSLVAALQREGVLAAHIGDVTELEGMEEGVRIHVEP